MPLTSFSDGITRITSSWLNKIDALYVTVFGEATTAAQARTALSVSPTSDVLLKASNLSDVASQATSFTNLVAPGGKMTGLFSMADRIDIAGAATIDLGAQTSNNIRITGSGATISSFGTNYKGPFFIQFGGTNTLVHTAGSLILPGSANITTANQDCALVIPTNTGWRVANYEKTDGTTSVVRDGQAKALSASVAGNAITISTAVGMGVEFNDGTNATCGALSLTVSSGSTLGTTAGVAARLWVVVMKNSGTPELAVINTWDGSNIYSIYPTDTISTTAEGGSGAADSAHVWYSTTARTSQPIAILGYIEITGNPAGTWGTSPTVVQGYMNNIPLPGQVIQRRRTSVRTLGTLGTTRLPYDNTIPQNTEGNSAGMDTAITPRSALNVLQFDTNLFAASSATNAISLALFQDTTADALAAVSNEVNSGPDVSLFRLAHQMVAGTASSTTFKLRIGSDGANDIRLNGTTGGAQLFNGVAQSIFDITEIQR